MAQLIRYCRGCNAQFAVPESDPRCPQCHVALEDGDLAATVDLAATILHEPSEAAGLPEGEVIESLLGRTLDLYSVESFLGKGGMAWVFLASHGTLYRPCALKVLCPKLYRRNCDLVDLFLSEARLAASLVHPNIVTVHNIGEADGKHFIEMEYVPGGSLQRIVERQGRLSAIEAIEYLMQVTAALGEAHRAGLVHRDFKPSNVLVRPDGAAKLADFGLAKRVTGESAGRRAPLQGTPYFMAPELFRGRPAGKPSDVYAVGVSLYYLLTGQFPFVQAALTDLAAEHAERPVPDVRRLAEDVPDEVAACVRECLAKEPAGRPQDGDAVYERLRAVFGRLRDFRSLVGQALGQRDVAWGPEGHRAAVSVGLPDGRRQTVYVEDSPAGRWDEPVIRIYSVCGPCEAGYFRRALEINAQIAHGALGLEEIDGEPNFVMVNSYPRATCDAEEIRKSVLEIARWADSVESTLTGDDRH